ncbi:MAG: hypothetical protein J0L60_06660 [Ignavibacteria bacterium]|nr:hypothetical protein [Ignavibacteria bacterium]
MQPTILELEITGKFRYLWLKYVRGVNLNVHCGRCLTGDYSTIVASDITIYDPFDLNEFPAKYYYLCGVATPPKWSNNFHLAFKYAPGKLLEIERNGVHTTIKDAEEIPIKWISPSGNSDIPQWQKNLAKQRGPSYFTCRNWQFACMIAEEFGHGN